MERKKTCVGFISNAETKTGRSQQLIQLDYDFYFCIRFSTSLTHEFLKSSFYLTLIVDGFFLQRTSTKKSGTVVGACALSEAVINSRIALFSSIR